MSLDKKESEPTNFIQWVGGAYYSIESYIKEAKKIGASRRVNRLPNNVVKGKSRIFLISDMQTEELRNKYREEYNRRLREAYVPKSKAGDKRYNSIKKPESMPRGEPMIFGYFTINSIVYITPPGTNVPEELKKRGVEAYDFQEGAFGYNDERGCGSLKVGGVYFISEDSMDKIKELAQSTVLESNNIHILTTPIPVRGMVRFRGIKEASEDITKKVDSIV